MRVVGIDTHKATLAACAVDEVGTAMAERTFPNDPGGFTELEAWLAEHQVERVGLEGSAGYGAAAARFLLGAGQSAVEVPPQLARPTAERPALPADEQAALAVPSSR